MQCLLQCLCAYSHFTPLVGRWLPDVAYLIIGCSSVATGGARALPYSRQAWPQDSCKSEEIFGDGGWGSDSSSPDLLADGEGARCAAPPQKPHRRIGPLGHVTGVPPTLKSWLRHR